MTSLAIPNAQCLVPGALLPKPEPRLPISIRQATERDLEFIDALQKKHSNEVAFATTKELLTYIKDGMALVAEETGSPALRAGSEGLTPGSESRATKPIAYCLYRDRYMKREDCGIVSQLVVDSSKHRGLVGAALIAAMFERLPYGVRLFCLWCAQDLQANHFWEALGFVPLAFRCGARGKEHGGTRREGTRLHIFWERRVRDGDEYPYWFPSQTTGGRSRENRISLPILPGKHWSNELPLVLPGLGGSDVPLLPAGAEGEEVRSLPKCKRNRTPKPPKPVVNPVSQAGGLWFAPPATQVEPPPHEKPKREKRPRQKNDPKHVAAARQLRDQYLEQVNAGLILPPSWDAGKYDVSRQLTDLNAGTEACTTQPLPPLLLKAA